MDKRVCGPELKHEIHAIAEMFIGAVLTANQHEYSPEQKEWVRHGINLGIIATFEAIRRQGWLNVDIVYKDKSNE